jgi:PEP-CTERM motif
VKLSLVVMLILCFAGEADATLLYTDNFAGSTLGPAWQVLSGQGSYAVSGNSLEYSLDGPLSSPSGWSNTSESIALTFSSTSWQLDLEANYHLSWLLPGYGSYTGPTEQTSYGSPGSQGARAFVAFDPVTESDRSVLGSSNVAGFERIVDPYYGSNIFHAYYDNTGPSDLLNPVDDYITNSVAGGTYWLRFIRDGGTLTMEYSYDGINYMNALTTSLEEPSSSFNELVLSGITYLTAGSYVSYSNLVIQDFSGASVPEPATMGLFSSALVGLAVFGKKYIRRP